MRPKVDENKALEVLLGFPPDLQSVFSPRGFHHLTRVFVCEACLIRNPNFITYWSELGPADWPK